MDSALTRLLQEAKVQRGWTIKHENRRVPPRILMACACPGGHWSVAYPHWSRRDVRRHRRFLRQTFPCW